MSVHNKRVKWSTSNLVNIAFSTVLSLANLFEEYEEKVTTVYKKRNY